MFMISSQNCSIVVVKILNTLICQSFAKFERRQIFMQ